jgi:hypothetical protein
MINDNRAERLKQKIDISVEKGFGGLDDVTLGIDDVTLANFIKLFWQNLRRYRPYCIKF